MTIRTWQFGKHLTADNHNLLPNHLQLDERDEKELEAIRAVARKRHEKARRAAKKQGRNFPLLPYECSWAYEEEFRKSRGERRQRIIGHEIYYYKR